MSAASPVTSPKNATQKKTGFALWMDRVIEECDRACVDFSPDPVHDLRVALRRCRSLADGLMAIDPSPDWKAMKRAGKKVFQSLGELRDVQVMEEWVAKLGDSSDAATFAMTHYLSTRQAELKTHAATALAEFDRKQWKRWGVMLPRRAAKVRSGSLVFKHLALERWTEAYELHRRAIRNGSKVALHSLRIGIKRFRYIVENFLPEEHVAWKDDLKEMQDLLGEIHDLDVFWATVQQIGAFNDAESRLHWHERITSERTERIEKYRAKMVGPNSLWHVWRAALPTGEQAEAAALRRMKLWASFIDPDVKHSAHVSRLALQLYDQLPAKSSANGITHSLRTLLEVAGILHNVGAGKNGDKERHKKPARLIRKLKPPLGWSAAELHLISAAVRYRKGYPEGAGRKAMAELMPEQRRDATRLAAILRIAEAFDGEHDGRIPRLRVMVEDRLLIIEAQGYSARDRMAQNLASARYLLETIYRKPILVKPMRVQRTLRVRSISSAA